MSTTKAKTKRPGLFRKHEPDESAYYMASQWKLMGRKLHKHKLAQISMWILGIFYVTALLAQFIAPQGLETYSAKYKNTKPSAIHIIDSEGVWHMPFVYSIKTERDPETLRRYSVEDTETLYPVKFFVKGEPYKFLSLFDTDLHLFGVDAPGVIFLYGTDSMGRDLFSRVMLGSQVSLTIPLAGVLISFILGVVLGGISGYFGGLVDNIIQRVIEILRSFPTLPLWMALSAAIPANIPTIQMYLYITLILSFISWTGLARTVRSKFISLREEDFVMAAKLSGVGDGRIILKHLVPGFMSYLIVNMSLSIPSMIIGETSMSFLGLGIRSPATSWGVLLDEAKDITNVYIYSWKLIPLVYVIVTVLAFNFLGDGLRDAADPYK